MVFATGMTIVLEAKESVELLYGGATQVWNFFSKNRLQPAAAVYFANCALYGGDSDGWRESLQSFTLIRSKQGFQIGDAKGLFIGFPGADMLPALLNAEYGSRWLGLLSVVATIADQHNGAHNLDQFVRKTASDPTRSFLLDRESCERLWTLSREVFVGSPYWYRFLEITSSILAYFETPEPTEFSDDRGLLYLIFPDSSILNSGQFLSNTMTAAFDLWQLSQKPESTGKQLWARGGNGCAQLIFYLTVVCGFFVRLGTGESSIVFGDQNSGQTEISIEIVLKDFETPWEIGYLLDDDSVDQSVRRVLLASAGEDAWRMSLVPDTKRSNSKYCVDIGERSSQAGQCLLPTLNALRNDLAAYDLLPYVSHWFSNVLHEYSYYHLVRSEKECLYPYPSAPKKEVWWTYEKSLSRAAVKSERLSTAINIFAPGILTNEDHENLIKKIRNLQKPESSGRLHRQIPKFISTPFCDCFSVDEKHKKAQFCRFDYFADTLKDVAKKAWICSYVAINQEYLRDIGPNIGSWHTSWLLDPIKPQDGFYTYFLDNILKVIARRLAGHNVHNVADCVGRVAGGFAIVVSSNEELAISQDPGHSIYIVPGGIATEERHFKQVVQSKSDEESRIKHPTETHSRLIFDLTTPQDYFGEVELRHQIRIGGDTATINSRIWKGQRRLYKLVPRIAIDRSVTIRTIDDCLGECVKGKLTESQLSMIAIDLPDKTHYTSPSRAYQRTGIHALSERGVLSGEEGCLIIFPARGNALVQRAIISQFGLRKVAILTGNCVHCAIHQSLREGMNALIC